ncbi:MAG: GNAT family N-acetyltransferase [Porticoccus sp.]|nr:GNAT family N-acetyltransferase [Porticoccus sp.]MBQ0806444.1 GNAT family N-acetyltransferase [Porticoccus sp.]
MMETVEYFPIEVERTSWEVSSDVLTDIRHKVFVEEQKVRVDEEIDEHDPHAVHWLAYGPNDKPMATGRMLPDGHIGRMAVLKEYRERSVGSSLMRKIIRYAIREGLEQVFLYAQIKAVPFYEGFGFIAQDDPFMDAGIPHKTMVLKLHHYRDNSPQRPLPEITDDDRERVSLDGAESFRDQAVMLVNRAHREIRIFSASLAPEVYSNGQFCDALYAFATSHPLARVRILVKNIPHLIQHTNKLQALCHRLPSRLQMRKFQSQEECLHTEFLLIDKTGILYSQEPERFIGYAAAHAPLESVELMQEFDNLWEQGELDPELRRLHI